MDLVVICGLPGSGKTTLARSLHSTSKGFIVHMDSYIKQVTDFGESKKIRLQVIDHIRNLRGCIIVEDTMELHSMRKPYMDVFMKQQGARICFIAITAPAHILMHRNQSRPASDRIDNRVLERMLDRWENFPKSWYSFVLFYQNIDEVSWDAIRISLENSSDVKLLPIRYIAKEKSPLQKLNEQLNSEVHNYIQTAGLEKSQTQAIIGIKRNLFECYKRKICKYCTADFPAEIVTFVETCISQSILPSVTNYLNIKSSCNSFGFCRHCIQVALETVNVIIFFSSIDEVSNFEPILL